ncbi:MAG: hypothetical protein QXV31_01835, partial [Zestosphaera sp.]
MASRPISSALWIIAFIIAAIFVAFIFYIGFDILAKGLDKPCEWIITQPFNILGRDGLFAISGVLWLVGTLIFFMELSGRTFKGLKIVRQ